METADAVVVGGGAVGCSLAYHLSLRGVDTVLLERRQGLGEESTGKCAGGVRQQFSNEVNVRVQMESVRLLRGFEEETGAPADFRQNGYLFLFTRPRQVVEFHDLMEMWHRAGLKEARWVSSEEASALNPLLDVSDVLGGTFCPSDGIASPAGVTEGYAAAARRRGARIRTGAEVAGIDVQAGRVAGVRTAAGEEISTRVVFVAAGAWSGQVGRMAGVEIPVLPYRRHIFVTDTFEALPRSAPMTVDFATSLYFHPEGDGVLIGMSDRDQPPGFDTETDWSFLEKVVEVATRRAPALETAGVKTGWAGLYETTPDQQAILGPVEEVPGLWCACGFSGHGFMQAPGAGSLLAQLLTEGTSEVDLTPLGWRRFATGRLVAEKNII
ncbi:MAG: NAD(P)/FAD-dependent oxidoreductase [Candidatus Dormibacterales bacterium]